MNEHELNLLLAAERRSPAWNIHLLTSTGDDMGRLDGVSGGRINQTSGSAVGESGSLALDQVLAREIDWRNEMVRLSYDPGVKGVPAWDVATLRFSRPGRQQTEAVTSFSVSLIGKTSVLEKAVSAQAFSAPKGTNPVTAAAGLVRTLTGETPAVTETSKTLASDLVIEPRTSWLTIINTLLEAADYRALWVSGAGVFQIGPYTRPANRPTLLTLTDGAASWHSPEWGFDADLEIPNHVILERQGSHDEPALVVEVYNDSPDDPSSIVNAPVLSHSDTAEFTDRATGLALARRKLADLQTSNSELAISCAPLPIERTHRFAFTDQGFDGSFVAWELDWDLDDLADMQIRAREVSG